MTDTPNELTRAVEALEADESPVGWIRRSQRHDAARLLREMARDFERYACHLAFCRPGGCQCGFLVARERWRIQETPEKIGRAHV